MPRLRTAVPLIGLLIGLLTAACGPAPSPAVSVAATTAPPTSAPASATPASSAAAPSAATTRELTTGSDPLPAGTYTRAGFRPRVTLTLDEGWFGGTLTDGFFDVQQDRGTADVVAVQFASVDGVAGSGATMTDATTASAAVETIRQNTGLVIVEESTSRLGGLEGLNVVVENRGPAHATVMKVLPGALGIDPARRLWIALFDTPDGLLAVMVGGSVAQWDRALTLAEPVLESVVVGG